MSPADRVAHVSSLFPSDGLFEAKSWVLSPSAFPLSERTRGLIDDLGPALRRFMVACNALYFQSAAEPEGELGWVARLLDLGKPEAVVALGRHAAWREALPGVIRPDLVLTEAGVTISEIDSLPGGIGLTAWLNEAYASLGEGVIGGPRGMLEGYAAAFPNEDVLISRESAGYEPEMRWLAAKLGREVRRSWERPGAVAGGHYRFFELFDLANVEESDQWVAAALGGTVTFSPPLKAFLEEKLWLALFWSPQLQRWWRESLSAEHFALLRGCIPEGWVMNPQPLPVWAEYPGLAVNSWQELKRFGGKARELVLKISGYSERGWGSRGVYIGHDMPQEAWARAIDEALGSFPQNPFVLQRFHKGMAVQHPAWDAERGETRMMKARVRLCPYYFVPKGRDETALGGVLATVCPADKKILHGMKDAMMLPCV